MDKNDENTKMKNGFSYVFYVTEFDWMWRAIHKGKNKNF